MNSKFVFSTFAITLAFSASLARAAESESKPAANPAAPPPTSAAPASPVVTLRELVAQVLQFNPELDFYKHEIAAAQGELRKAGEWPNPTLGVSLGQKRVSDSSNILVGEGLAWSVSVSQTFDFSGRPALRKAIAGRQVAQAEAGLAQFKKELEARVLELGYDLLLAQRQYEAAEEVSARAQAVRSVLVARDPAGIAPLLESRAIEARVVVFERAAAEARLKLLAALQEINILRGSAPDAPLTLANTAFDFRDPPSYLELLRSALENNYVLKQKRLELEQQGFSVSLARKEPVGGVTLAPFIAQEKAGDQETTFGISVELPLPIWQQNQGEILVARARRDQAQVLLNVAQRDLDRDVATAALAYRLSLENLRRWGKDFGLKFREAADLGDRSYRLGTIPLSTYLELQSGYIEALSALLETEAEALKRALRLSVLTGVPLETLLPSLSHD